MQAMGPVAEAVTSLALSLPRKVEFELAVESVPVVMADLLKMDPFEAAVANCSSSS